MCVCVCVCVQREDEKFLADNNCQISRTSNYIDTKLSPLSKLEKRNQAALKKMTMTPTKKLWRHRQFSHFRLVWSMEAEYRK